MPIWDDVRRGAQTVADGGQRLARLVELKAQAKKLEGSVGDQLYELGSKVVELHQRGEVQHVDLDGLFLEIEALQRELREKEQEIDDIVEYLRGAKPTKTKARCPECGGTIRDGDRFCRHCGHDLAGD